MKVERWKNFFVIYRKMIKEIAADGRGYNLKSGKRWQHQSYCTLFCKNKGRIFRKEVYLNFGPPTMIMGFNFANLLLMRRPKKCNKNNIEGNSLFMGLLHGADWFIVWAFLCLPCYYRLLFVFGLSPVNNNLGILRESGGGRGVKICACVIIYVKKIIFRSNSMN